MAQVFISYRWESDEFRALVREFAEQVREAGIEVVLDQFYSEAHPGGPDEGWDRWCSTQVKRARKVLIVCSQGWFRAFEGSGRPGEGLGAAHEARLIHTELYQSAWKSGKHRLLGLEGADEVGAPLELRHIHRFRSGVDFDEVVAWIEGPTARREATEASLDASWPEPLPAFVPDLANRDEVWQKILELMTGSAGKRVLLLEGATNHGKSGLVRECVRYARDLGIHLVRIDFKGGHRTLPDVLAEFDLALGPDLPNFHRAGGKDPFLLRGDLRQLSRPALVLFDTYEKAVGNRDVQNWVEHQFLADVDPAPALAVIVAGQICPDWRNSLWTHQAQHRLLGPIDDPAPWEEWVNRSFPAVSMAEVDFRSLVMASDGVPGEMAGFCATIAARLAREGR